MKNFLFILGLCFSTHALAATTLMQVYEEALSSDPIFQQAIAQHLANKESVPLSIAPLLPQANIVGGPLVNKFHIAGTNAIPANGTASHGYSFTLAVTQTVFNYAEFAALSSARAASRQADATLNAATQQLMLRVAQAYFAILKDEDFLHFSRANRKAYQQQLEQVKIEYKVGLKTITDVYTAEASYDSAAANDIAAETALANDKENLRVITGNYYPTIATLKENFPLISPRPSDMAAWVRTAQMQNWAIKAALYANHAAGENVKQEFAGHYPTVNLQGSYNVAYNNSYAGSNYVNNSGISTTSAGSFVPIKTHSNDAQISLNLNVPIFEGGSVVAQTRQAKYHYRVTSEQLEQTVRQTINTTRQSYMGILAGIKQIEADKQAVKSSMSSLSGLREGYKVGTQTLVDVLNQQEKVFHAQTQYATDRYAYIINLLTLKQATGTLSQLDLMAINAWLADTGEI